MDWDRIEWARRWARSQFVIAGFAIFLCLLVWIAAPGFTEPTFGPGLPLWTTLGPTAIGIAGVIFGLIWMWRIYKGPTRYEDRALWRYRDRS
jgi:hypothetical protein